MAGEKLPEGKLQLLSYNYKLQKPDGGTAADCVFSIRLFFCEASCSQLYGLAIASVAHKKHRMLTSTVCRWQAASHSDAVSGYCGSLDTYTKASTP